MHSAPVQLVDPAVLLQRPYRLACPACGERVVIQPRNAGGVAASCLGLDCGYWQHASLINGVATTLASWGPASRQQVEAFNSFSIAPPIRCGCRFPRCRCAAVEGGLCDGHRSLWIAAGRPEPVSDWLAQHADEPAQPITPAAAVEPPRGSGRWPGGRGICRAPGCSGNVAGQGLCSTHYGRWKRLRLRGEAFEAWIAEGCPGMRTRGKAEPAADAITPDIPAAPAPSVGEEPRVSEEHPMSKAICEAPNCKAVVAGHGLCAKHYSRWINVGRPVGEQRTAWIKNGCPTRREMESSAAPPPASEEKPQASPEPSVNLAAAVVRSLGGNVPQRVVFPAPQSEVLIQRLGNYFTLTNPEGLVLAQIPAAG